MVILAVIIEFSGFGLIAGSGIANQLGISQDVVQQGFDVRELPLFTVVIALLAAGVASGIAIGFLTKAQSENFIVLPFIFGEFLLFFDVISGFSKMLGIFGPTSPLWAASVVYALMLALTVGFIITMIDWFRGNVT